MLKNTEWNCLSHLLQSKVDALRGILLESGMFEIRYTRILNIKERQKVLRTFILEDNTPDSMLIVVSCRYYHSSFQTGKGVIQ